MRLLVIAARDEFRLLVRKHVEIQWPDAAIVEHALGEEPGIDANFAGAGFDAVIIVAAPPTDAATNSEGCAGSTGEVSEPGRLPNGIVEGRGASASVTFRYARRTPPAMMLSPRMRSGGWNPRCAATAINSSGGLSKSAGSLSSV